MSDDIEAALAALEHIKETLSSYRGLEPKKDEVEGSPLEESTESPAEADAELADPTLEIDEAVPAPKDEPEPMRLTEHLGAMKPKPKVAAVLDVEVKRGPGRPKKVR